MSIILLCVCTDSTIVWHTSTECTCDEHPEDACSIYLKRGAVRSQQNARDMIRTICPEAHFTPPPPLADCTPPPLPQQVFMLHLEGGVGQSADG